MLPILAAITAALIGYIILKLALFDPRDERIHRAKMAADLADATARMARQAPVVRTVDTSYVHGARSAKRLVARTTR